MLGRYSPVLLLALALACNRQAPQPTPVAASASAVAKAHGEHGEEGHEEAKEEGHGSKSKGKGSSKDKGGRTNEADGSRFSVPFVWETSKTDPLAVARDHLREILADNARYIKDHPRPRVPGPTEQRPSTTLVTCSDSAVQVPVLDATPENDMFVVRNMGNQLENSLGSVEYGISELKTPVLLIVGHTDCDAVHLAISKDSGKGSKALRRELAHIPQPKAKKLASEGELLKQAVIENVHLQVEAAISQFQSLVHTSKLTIVGAVYDPGNELRQGAGKLHIINVNSNRDPAAMSAFVAAIMSDNKIIRLEPDGEQDEHGALEDESEGAAEEHEAPEEARVERHSRPASAARHARPEPHSEVHATVASRHEAPSGKKHEAVAFDLDQLEATTREKRRTIEVACRRSVDHRSKFGRPQLNGAAGVPLVKARDLR